MTKLMSVVYNEFSDPVGRRAVPRGTSFRRRRRRLRGLGALDGRRTIHLLDGGLLGVGALTLAGIGLGAGLCPGGGGGLGWHLACATRDAKGRRDQQSRENRQTSAAGHVSRLLQAEGPAFSYSSRVQSRVESIEEAGGRL